MIELIAKQRPSFTWYAHLELHIREWLENKRKSIEWTNVTDFYFNYLDLYPFDIGTTKIEENVKSSIICSTINSVILFYMQLKKQVCVNWFVRYHSVQVKSCGILLSAFWCAISQENLERYQMNTSRLSSYFCNAISYISWVSVLRCYRNCFHPILTRFLQEVFLLLRKLNTHRDIRIVFFVTPFRSVPN